MLVEGLEFWEIGMVCLNRLGVIGKGGDKVEFTIEDVEEDRKSEGYGNLIWLNKTYSEM